MINKFSVLKTDLLVINYFGQLLVFPLFPKKKSRTFSYFCVIWKDDEM